jgi:hypothetical protein
VISTQNQIKIETKTETQVQTVTVQPDTVTVALQGPEAISSSLNSAFSVESQQLEINSQIAPNNPFRSLHPPPSSATRFTRTIVVPIVEATKTSAASGQPPATDVYFIGESNGEPTWLSNFTPHESMTIGTTTVTLSPMPSKPAKSIHRLEPVSISTQTNTTMTEDEPNSESTNGAGFTGMGYEGWNSSARSAATVPSGYCPTCEAASNAPSSFRVITTRRTSSITTITVHQSASVTSEALPTNAYGSAVNITFPTADYGLDKRSGGENRRRAVCEWITATLQGTLASWPNNWDGSKTVNCAEFTVSNQQPQPTPRMYSSRRRYSLG